MSEEDAQQPPTHGEVAKPKASGKPATIDDAISELLLEAVPEQVWRQSSLTLAVDRNLALMTLYWPFARSVEYSFKMRIQTEASITLAYKNGRPEAFGFRELYDSIATSIDNLTYNHWRRKVCQLAIDEGLLISDHTQGTRGLNRPSRKALGYYVAGLWIDQFVNARQMQLLLRNKINPEEQQFRSLLELVRVQTVPLSSILQADVLQAIEDQIV